MYRHRSVSCWSLWWRKVFVCLERYVYLAIYFSHNVRKRSFAHVSPAKIQISLRICAVWSDSSLSAFWIVKNANFLHAANEDCSDHVCAGWLEYVECKRQKGRFLTLMLIYRHSEKYHVICLIISDTLILPFCLRPWSRQYTFCFRCGSYLIVDHWPKRVVYK